MFLHIGYFFNPMYTFEYLLLYPMYAFECTLLKSMFLHLEYLYPASMLLHIYTILIPIANLSLCVHTLYTYILLLCVYTYIDYFYVCTP